MTTGLVCRPKRICAAGASTEEVLRAYAGRFAAYGADHPQTPLLDFCHTLNVCAPGGPCRFAVVTGKDDSPESLSALCGTLAAYARGERPTGMFTGECGQYNSPKLAFLFAGQGSQYANMGAALHETEPLFRSTFDWCSELLESDLGKSLLSVVYPEATPADEIDQTKYTQPALFAFEYALAVLWRSWGIEPDFVLGHSVGELSAACFAGAFSLEDGLKLIAARGRMIQSLPAGGGMMVVSADMTTVSALIGGMDHPAVCIAALNGPDLQVISGPLPALQEIARACDAEGVPTQSLAVSHAFHSPAMEPILGDFAAVAEGISCHPLQIPMVSNLDGRTHARGSLLPATRWVSHIAQPVLFETGMRTLEREGCLLFLEIGPATTLVAMGQRCIDSAGATWMPCMRKGRDLWRTMLDTLATLFVHGANPDWSAFDPGCGTLPGFCPGNRGNASLCEGSAQL